MKTIVVANPKGGCGKTTVAVNLGVALSQVHRVCLAERDLQGTLTKWHKRRVKAMPETPLHRAEIPAVGASFKRLAPHYDTLIVDTPAGMSQYTLELAKLADVVLVPCRTSLADIEGAMHLVYSLTQEKIPFAFVINAAVARAVVTTETEDLLRQYGRVLSSHLNQSTAYMDMWTTGKVPLEMRRTSTSGKKTHALTLSVMELLK